MPQESRGSQIPQWPAPNPSAKPPPEAMGNPQCSFVSTHRDITAKVVSIEPHDSDMRTNCSLRIGTKIHYEHWDCAGYKH